jgi:5'-nucleotidase
VVKSTNPRGETVYWVGAAGGAQDAGAGTDFHAIAQRKVSVTPLQIDLTQYTSLDEVRNWLREPALT